MRKSKLINRVVNMVRQSGGAHLTRQDRETGLREFVMYLYASGISLPRLEAIRGKHLRRYIEHLISKGQAIRTIQKKAGHVRWLWRQLGRSDLANSPDLSNAAIGIKTPPGGRRGSNKPATDTKISALIEKAERLRRQGIAMASRLMVAIGLRRNEVAYAGSRQIQRWLQQLPMSPSFLLSFPSSPPDVGSRPGGESRLA